MPSSSETPTALDTIRNHLGLSASIGLGGWLLLRVWQFSRWDTEMALGVLANSSLPRFALGAFLELLPAIGSVFFLLTLFNVITQFFFNSREGSKRLYDSVLFASAVILALFTVPWTWFIVSAVLGSALALFSWSRHRQAKTPVNATGPPAWAFVFLLLLVLAVSQDGAWLPTERIVVSDTPHVGYVLNDQGRWTTVLVEETRTLLVVQSSEVSERTVCAQKEAPEPAVIGLFREETHNVCSVP